MNTFISKKLGEVLAFARVGKGTMDKGSEGFKKLFEANEIESMEKTFKDLEDSIVALAHDEGVGEEVEKSAKDTEAKVGDMRDTYINGKWDDKSEILEWTGFYTGAALVHWYLVSGAAISLKDEALEQMSLKAIKFYNALFVSDENILMKIGERGSQE